MNSRPIDKLSRALPNRITLWIVIVLVCSTRLAIAHPAPFSYLDIDLDAEAVTGSIVIHDFDAAHELGIDPPAQLLDSTFAARHRDALIALIESRLTLSSESRELTPHWGALVALGERQSLRIAFTLDAGVRGQIDVRAVLFPYDRNHQTFINVYERGALKHQAILDAQHTSLTYYAGTLQGRWKVVTTFVKAGVHHILIGPDHILFLLGLLLLGGSWWRLTTIVTAFTIGHSITLSLAALGVVHAPPSIVEPAIALSIIVVGVDNLLVKRQRRTGVRWTGVRVQRAQERESCQVPRAQEGRSGRRLAGQNIDAAQDRDLRAFLAAMFGLIHGFGFAAVLTELGLPQAALGWSLAAFNIGVEIGQLFIVLVLIGLGRLAMRVPAYRSVYGERFLTLASVGVIAAGVYWFVQRIGFTSAA